MDYFTYLNIHVIDMFERPFITFKFIINNIDREYLCSSLHKGVRIPSQEEVNHEHHQIHKYFHDRHHHHSFILTLNESWINVFVPSS